MVDRAKGIHNRSILRTSNIEAMLDVVMLWSCEAFSNRVDSVWSCIVVGVPMHMGVVTHCARKDGSLTVSVDFGT